MFTQSKRITATFGSQKVSLAEADEKQQEAVETTDPLEVEKSNLNVQVEILQGRLQQMGKVLHESYRWSADEMNEIHMKEDEMKKSVMQTVKVLKLSLAEAEEKQQMAVETINQLEVEKSDLKHQVEELQGTVQDMGNVLTETERECDKLINPLTGSWTGAPLDSPREPSEAHLGENKEGSLPAQCHGRAGVGLRR
ncbi:uncharacterized protein LOC108274916 isoform X2 [Ictalurus punctatus]|uniref:Uncharacterized protein LOC108274916 isoform X2 n=1 Tax=Ictalurus punctatus TaxID=7998 RepID=A0A2D0SED2_ICTPU|nr:uncharacterized protein LOC108274916 isoform X2 [Ictalurus punctatus]